MPNTQLTFSDRFPSSLDIRAMIEKLMNEVGCKPNLKGFTYMTRAIELVYDDNSMLHGIVKKVYSRIAVESGTTASCVERNCRTLLKLLWTEQSTATLGRFFGDLTRSGRSIPSIKEFICLFCEVLSSRLEIQPEKQ